MPDFIKVKIRRGTSADWSTENPVLALGEVAADIDKHGVKVGNGTSRWNELPFCSPEIIDNLVTGGTDAALSAEQGKILKALADEKASKTELTQLETDLTQIINTNAVVVEDSLTSANRKNALSANQGRILNEKINTLIVEGGGTEVVDDLETADAAKALSANQGVVLKGMVDNKADVTEITRLEQDINNIIAEGGGPEIVNDLTSGGENKALSAEQGKVLKGLIPEVTNDTNETSAEKACSANIGNWTFNNALIWTNVCDNLDCNGETFGSSAKVLSANQGRVLKGLIDAVNTRVDNITASSSGYSSESWTFSLENGSTVTKEVVLN